MSGFSNNSNLPLETFQGFENQSATIMDVFDRRFATGTYTCISGTIYYEFFTPSQNLTVTGLTLASGVIASAGLTLARMGLYSFDETTATRLAQTANDTSLFNAPFSNFYRAFDNSVASSVYLIAGKRYGVAVIMVGTTPAQLATSQPAGSLTGLTPKLSQQQSGQADLVGTSSGLFNSQNNFFARLT